MFSNDMLQAYLNTTYQVKDLNIKIRIGQIDEHLDRMLEERKVEEWAFITVYNPRSVVLTDYENSMRHQELISNVSSFTCFEGYGVGEDPTWIPERSLLILGLSRESAIELGLKYVQNAIVVGRKGSVAEIVVLISD
jgi:hypothetical protein